MHVTKQHRNGIAIVTINAETLTADVSQPIRRDLLAALDGESKVILDLGKVNVIDSSGLGVLVVTLKHLKSNDGDLRLCNLTSRVESLLETVRLNLVFQTHETAEDAVASFDTP